MSYFQGFKCTACKLTYYSNNQYTKFKNDAINTAKMCYSALQLPFNWLHV